MKHLWMLGAVALISPVCALGQTGYVITGGLSNFDVHNHCDDPCDEFEIEIEDIRPEDVVHTYRNGNYGAPTVTLSASGLSTIIDYRHPQHLTPVGGVEHYGVSLRALSPTNVIRVRWMKGGQPATVNGQVPQPGGGSTPATQPVMPSISSDMTFGTVGDGIAFTVTNNDQTQGIWIKRRAVITQGAVSLESLMPNDPVVTSTIPVDAVPIFLDAGASITTQSDLIEVEDNQSGVFAAQYYQNIRSGGPFGQYDILGPELGNVMTASLAAQESVCQFSAPIFLSQPMNVTVDEGRSFDLAVNVEGNDFPVTYQWMRDGLPLANSGNIHGVTGDELSVDELTPELEGFYSVRATNTCGSVVSQSALVFITGHNVPPPRTTPPCDPDVNQDGNADQGDVDYLIDVVAGGDNYTGIDPDFNVDGNTDQGDIDALIDVIAGGACP